MIEKFSKYEKARILGARALQIAMDAPILVKMSKEQLMKIKHDPLKIAKIEFDSGVLPITVKRPFPEKAEEKLNKEKEREKGGKDEEIEEKRNIAKEVAEEKKIKEEGEIMELAKPEDEVEEEIVEEPVEEIEE